MTPAFSSFAAFLAMGGYALYVWLSVSVALIVLIGLGGFALWHHYALLEAIRRQQHREQRLRRGRQDINKEQADAGTS